jgi:hypothetical protein
MASKTDIFNIALTMLGAQTVQNSSDNSRNARVLDGVYETVRRSELRKRPVWNFSVKNVKLPEDATPPLFGKNYAYTLPGDFLSMAPPYDDQGNYGARDWTIQKGKIFSNETAPLELRYVADVNAEGEFDPLFAMALAAKLAEICCESITQSNTKKQLMGQQYQDAIREARKADSFDGPSPFMPIDTYETVRL